MEKEIIYVGINEFYSKKKDQTYYQIQYIADRQCVIEFISAEQYKEIKEKNIEFLKKCVGRFDFNASTRTIRIASIVK